MFPPTLFRFVARFARVRIEDSSWNRFVSTAYFAQSQTTLLPHAYFSWGECSWGKTTGVEPSGGNIPFSLISATGKSADVSDKVNRIQDLYRTRHRLGILLDQDCWTCNLHASRHHINPIRAFPVRPCVITIWY